MGFKGSLESFNLADIFQNLSMNQQTGTLRVTGRDRMKCIYFHGGQARYLSRGPGKNILLGDMLLGRGLATREQVDSALLEQKNSGRLLGEVVVALGICSRDDVDNLVRFQIEEEIYDLFGWESADFEFVDGPPPEDMFDPEQQATELALDTNHLIMEAARRIDEWERIRQSIPSTSEVFMPVVREDGTTSLSPDAEPAAARIFSYLGNTRDIDAVVQDSHFSRFEVASHLAAMLDAGSVRKAGAEELKAGAATCMELGQPERSARLMEKALSLDPSDPAIRGKLAEALISLGEKERAAIHLGVLGDERAAQGNQEEAATAYRKILAALPRHAVTHEKMARLCTEQGETQKALDHYTKLIQSLIGSGRLEEAAARCREGLALAPENAELRSALAKVLLSSGDEKAAIEEFERLGEMFARASQVRPAAEVFRRILQIDPRNKHAKNRLKAIVSGGVARTSHVLRNVAILVVLAVLSGGTYIVLHELALQTRFSDTESEHAEFMRQKRFDEVAALWEPYLKEWSFVFDYKKQARAYVSEAEKRLEEVHEEEIAARKEAAKAMRGTFDEAKRHAEKYEFSKAAAKLREVIASEDATAEMKTEAAGLLAKTEKEDREVREYLEYKKQAVRREDPDSLEDELLKTRAISDAYPRNPALQNLERPLLIEADPPGTDSRPAEVHVGGKLRGRAPVIIRFPLGTSPEISVKMAGYVQVQKRLAVPASARMMVSLRRDVARHYDARSRISSLAAGPGGLLLIADQNGVLAAVEPGAPGAAGERKALWRFPTGEPLIGIVSGLTVRGNSVYFGTDKLYALDLLGGPRRRWPTPVPVGGRILAPPSAGRVKMILFMEFIFGTCVGTDEVGTVWAVESKTGKPRWEAKPSERRKPTRSRPFLRGERLFVPFDDGEVYALKADSGTVIAKWSTGSIAKLTSLAWDGKYAWVGTGGGKLCRLDLEGEGRSVRAFDVGRPIVTDLALHKRVAYFGDSGGGLHAFSLDELDNVWERPFAGEGRPTGRPAVSERRVYFGTDKGWVYAVDRAKGEPVWKHRPCRDVRGGVLFDGRRLYVGGADGVVYAYDEKQIP